MAEGHGNYQKRCRAEDLKKSRMQFWRSITIKSNDAKEFHVKCPLHQRTWTWSVGMPLSSVSTGTDSLHRCLDPGHRQFSCLLAHSHPQSFQAAAALLPPEKSPTSRRSGMPGGVGHPCCVAKWEPGGRRPSAESHGRRQWQGSHLHTEMGGRLTKCPIHSILRKDCSNALQRHTGYSPPSNCARIPAVIVTCRVSSLIGWTSHTKP
jgi:hypothetical protein